MSEPALAVESPSEIKLNISFGAMEIEGYSKIKTPLPKRWPWDDASVIEIASNYYLNYLDGAERIKFMNECGRVLKPGGKLCVRVWDWTCIHAIADPLCKWPPLTGVSFLIFNKEWREREGRGHYPVTCDFDFTYAFSLDPAVASRNREYQEYATKHLNNAVQDLIITLVKRGT